MTSVSKCGDCFLCQYSTSCMFQNFDLSRRNMIRRAHYWVKKMVNAKQSIARLAEPFIPDGTVSCCCCCCSSSSAFSFFCFIMGLT